MLLDRILSWLGAKKHKQASRNSGKMILTNAKYLQIGLPYRQTLSDLIAKLESLGFFLIGKLFY